MRVILALLATLGIIVSSLALRVHYSHDVEPCDINAHWDCGIVNHSRFAMFHGVPVAAIGIAGYAALLVCAVFGLRKLLLASAAAGFCYAAYLTNIERNVLEVWCLYCVCSQGVITLIMLMAVGWVAMGRRKTAYPMRKNASSVV